MPDLTKRRTPNADETQLVRALVHASRDARASLSEVDLHRVDWTLVLACARRHRLGPLLHAGASNHPSIASALPVEFVLRLSRSFAIELARAVVRLHHLDELAAVASRRRLTMCLLKGIAFAKSLYAHPASRPMADVDILVRPFDFDRWRDELENLGYVAEDHSDHAVCFRRRQSGVFVELHRSLTSCPRFVGVETEGLFERSRPLSETAPPEVRTLSWEDHLVHLCLHASFQHGLRQPAINGWDASSIVRRADFDEDEFLWRARSLGIQTWIYGGLSLCETIFPNRLLRAMRDALSEAVPARLRSKVNRLSPGELLSPANEAVFGTPFRRLVWAGSPVKSLSLLIETTRAGGTENEARRGATLRRASQLISNHVFRRLRPFESFRWPTWFSPRPASLGDVRDV